MKALQLLINDILPEDVRDDYTFDKKSMGLLASRLAAKHPDKYQDIIHEIQNVGRNAAYHQGTTLTLADMYPVIDTKGIYDAMDKELVDARIYGKTKDEIANNVLSIYDKYASQIETDTIRESLNKNNNIGNTVISGARGSPSQLKGMISTPALYSDYKDKPIPLFVRHSFGQGLRPYEYLASTFGTRKGVIATKNATAQAGDLGKLLAQIAAPIVVTENDCGVTNGIDLTLDDDSLQGRILAIDVGNLKAGTILDRDALGQLRKKNVKTVVARSALTCNAKEGVCSKCLGADPRGKLKNIGYAAGITAASTIGEPIAQCLAIGTRVLLADGTDKAIELIKPGDYVLGVDENGIVTPTKVLNNFDNGLQECNTYIFKSTNVIKGAIKSVTCTSNHRMLLCNSSEYYVDNLQCATPGDDKYKAAWVSGFDDSTLIDIPEAFALGVDPYLNVLPDTICQWSNKSVYKFIAGYLTTHGYIVSGDTQQIAFISRTLEPLKTIATLIQLRVGCHVGVIESFRNSDSYTYDFTIFGNKNLKLFKSKIGPFISNPDHLGYLNPEELTNNDDSLEPILVDIIPQGLKQVYDLEVEHPSHLFLLKDFLITHNSGLNTKHSGGVASKKKTFSGFDVISQIVQTPDTFPNEATVALKSGTITSIKPASQGGNYIGVDGEEHYVLPNFDIFVKVGDTVEAGDQLSDGIVDSAAIVTLRGLGAGRRFYSERLKKALDESNIATDKKNTELIARGAINHIEIDDYDENEDYLPGDVTKYNEFAYKYKPNSDSKEVSLDRSIGKYLQKPILHYSIGTKLTPNMVKRISNAGLSSVQVSEVKPNFSADMIRLRNSPQVNDSWIQRMSTSYIKTNLNDSAIRGLESNTRNSNNFADTLARGVDFAKDIETSGKF